MSMSVYLSVLIVCLSAYISQKLHSKTLSNFICQFPVAVGLSSSYGIAVCTFGFVDDFMFQSVGQVACHVYSYAERA